jgi:hypothetical protein
VDQAFAGYLMGRNLLNGIALKYHFTFEGDITFGGAAMDAFFPYHQAGYGPQKGGFASTVGPHQADHFAFLDVHAQVIDDHGFIKTNG